MKVTRTVLFSALVLLAVMPLAAQSNDRIDELLSQDPAETGVAAYLVLSAAGLVEEDATPDEAVRYAVNEGMLPPGVSSSEPISFGYFSYLLTRSFAVPGGVMYRLIPGPRYAAREVIYQGWSGTRREIGEVISGDTVVRVLSVYLNDQESE